MQTGRYPAVPDDFGHWLAGFIDGEGSFIIHRQGQTTWVAHFYLNLRADDRPILEEIQRVTGLGRLYAMRRTVNRGNDNPAVQWKVYRLGDKLRLIELLDGHPLRAKKARDYALWREAVLHVSRFSIQGKRGGTDRLAEISQHLRSVRAYDGANDDLLPLADPPPTLFDLVGGPSN